MIQVEFTVKLSPTIDTDKLMKARRVAIDKQLEEAGEPVGVAAGGRGRRRPIRAPHSDRLPGRRAIRACPPGAFELADQ
jgi:hypothetical protein